MKIDIVKRKKIRLDQSRDKAVTEHKKRNTKIWMGIFVLSIYSGLERQVFACFVMINKKLCDYMSNGASIRE